MQIVERVCHFLRKTIGTVKTDGRSLRLSRWKRRTFDTVFKFSNLLNVRTEVDTGHGLLRFECRTFKEVWRASTAFTKETGTVDWLTRTIVPGDVYYDIGANIGVYALYATCLMQDRGRVYAFEAYPPNVQRLVANVLANDLGDRVVVVASALSDDFHVAAVTYDVADAGASGAWTDRVVGRDTATGQRITDVRATISVDQAVAAQVAEPPTVVKIDVDGDEELVLRGMKHILESSNRPRSVQIETRPNTATAVSEFMGSLDYVAEEVHYAASTVQQIRMGRDPKTVVRNEVYSYGSS